VSIANFYSLVRPRLSKWPVFQVGGHTMIATIGFSCAITPIIGCANFVESFAGGLFKRWRARTVNRVVRVVTAGVDAYTGRHSSVLDPAETDGAIGARLITADAHCSR
jgi:hypothetical protein